MEIIGVGGVNDAPSAIEKVLAGACALQVVTGFRGVGTAVAGRINRGILDYMDREGVKNITDLVGAGHNM